mmetsp:Transcript_16547/g.36073  ORF Transcript_16547/g.36073 Transcript_16547/m.36073 type:complete len:291 (-) Transcript_16547:1027-1899(-)
MADQMMPEECVLRSSEDTAWLINSAILVLTMQGGFALMESGSSRSLNLVNVLVKNIFDLVAACILFWGLGYGFIFGESEGIEINGTKYGILGTSMFFLDEDLDFGLWFFQLSFVATASTIDSGAIVERMKLHVYFGLSAFMTVWIYPIQAHWVWNSSGWLNQLGFIDFAGASVVHLCGGVSGLLCTCVIGPRLGFFDDKELPKELEFIARKIRLSHKVFEGESVHVLFGTLLLLFGWFGFNCGSTLSLSGTEHVNASNVAAMTMFGGSAGAIVGTILSFAQNSDQADPAG